MDHSYMRVIHVCGQHWNNYGRVKEQMTTC